MMGWTRKLPSTGRDFVSWAATLPVGFSLKIGIPVSEMSRLAEMGHPVAPVSGLSRAVFGRGQIIFRDPNSGVFCGGSDPRSDGCVMSLA